MQEDIPAEVFKNYPDLRDYQYPVFEALDKAGNKVRFKAPIGFGKTFIACKLKVEELSRGEISSVTFSIPNYEMRNKIIDDLRASGSKNHIIVCPVGMTFPGSLNNSKKRFNLSMFDPEKYRGTVIDLDFVKKEFPGYKPYWVLLQIQQVADITIVQHKMLETNTKLKRSDALVVDDADIHTRDTKFLLAQYDVFEKHLQARRNSSSDFKELKAKIEPMKDKVPALYAMLDFMAIPENPEEIEASLIIQQEMKPETELFRIFQRSNDEGKTEDQKLREGLQRRIRITKLAISQASNETKLKGILEEMKQQLAVYLEGYEYLIAKDIRYAIHWDYRIEDFFNALLNPEFTVKASQREGKFTLLEVFMRRKSTFMDVVKKYRKILWISATVDASDPDFKGFKLVESTHDPHADNKKIVYIARERIPEILKESGNRNIFVIANSKDGAMKFQEEYGGEILTKERFDAIISQAKQAGGNLAISYVLGPGSRGLDVLANLFDIVIIESWKYRSITEENGKFYDEESRQRMENLSDVLQINGRVMRGSNNHILFIVQDKEDTQLFDYIKSENPQWEIWNDENLSGVVNDFIPERKEVEKKPFRLYRKVQKLKNGDNIVSLEGRATDEEISKIPDYMDF